MQTFDRGFGFWLLILALAGCAGSSGSGVPPGSAAASFRPSTQAPLLYAYAPSAGLVAEYAASASGPTAPVATIAGARTGLSTGNGLAADADGTIYVLAGEDFDQSGRRLRVLVFAPGAAGNAAPERTMVLPAGLESTLVGGLALDGRGNFWIASSGSDTQHRHLFRFPAAGSGPVEPNAAIAPVLATPDGLLPAYPQNVAVDRKGNVYCDCALVHLAAMARGVTEYAIGASEKPKLVRSFYDFSLPDFPPPEIAVDDAGTVYLAGSFAIWAYDGGKQSGQTSFSRAISIPANGSVHLAFYAIAADRRGSVYAVTGPPTAAPGAARIAVFGPHANGITQPRRWIDDPKHLIYGVNTYGTLLTVR